MTIAIFLGLPILTGYCRRMCGPGEQEGTPLCTFSAQTALSEGAFSDPPIQSWVMVTTGDLIPDLIYTIAITVWPRIALLSKRVFIRNRTSRPTIPGRL